MSDPNGIQVANPLVGQPALNPMERWVQGRALHALYAAASNRLEQLRDFDAPEVTNYTENLRRGMDFIRPVIEKLDPTLIKDGE